MKRPLITFLITFGIVTIGTMISVYMQAAGFSLNHISIFGILYQTDLNFSGFLLPAAFVYDVSLALFAAALILQIGIQIVIVIVLSISFTLGGEKPGSE